MFELIFMITKAMFDCTDLAIGSLSARSAATNFAHG